jgi:sterol desaturase/sphingolipid hydroxylase (fatty acid hydroxylase superfamily)
MAPGAGPSDFLVLLGLVLAAVVTVLLATGLSFEIKNARHPERKVQKNRVNRRKWQELARAPGSLMTLSLCFAFGLFAQWQGWALTPVKLTWWNGIPLLIGSVLLYDAWFFWVHRLLHSRPMFRFHRLHHTSATPTVWTNHHETVVEALLNQLYYAIIVFLLPIPWQTLVVQKLYDQISGMLGHAGYEHFASSAGRAPWPLASTVFHDQHHAYFHYNFAHTFSFWDRWLGSLHPNYDETVASFEPGCLERNADAS